MLISPFVAIGRAQLQDHLITLQQYIIKLLVSALNGGADTPQLSQLLSTSDTVKERRHPHPDGSISANINLTCDTGIVGHYPFG